MKTWLLVAFGMIFLGTNMPMNAQNSYNFPALFHDDGDGFVNIAHRGASAYFPENTMAAFRGALEMQAEMIELDVMLSKDGVPVVFHDAKLNHHTDGSGPVNAYTLAELKKLDAGSWFNDEFAGEPIPTLEEVLKFAKDKIVLNIEIKAEAITDELQGGVEEKSLQLVKKYKMEGHILFSSFDYRAAEHLKQLQPNIPVALLYEKRQSAGRSPSKLVADYKADAFNCSRRQLTKEWIEDLKSLNIPVFVYTVDQPKRMRSLISRGVSGIFTNKPDVLRDVASDLNQDN